MGDGRREGVSTAAEGWRETNGGGGEFYREDALSFIGSTRCGTAGAARGGGGRQSRRRAVGRMCWGTEGDEGQLLAGCAGGWRRIGERYRWDVSGDRRKKRREQFAIVF